TRDAREEAGRQVRPTGGTSRKMTVPQAGAIGPANLPQAELLMGDYVFETRPGRKHSGEGEAAVEALKGVDIGVAAGEMLAIMGRSGSGKSTLLTLLGGIDGPPTGQVLLGGWGGGATCGG